MGKMKQAAAVCRIFGDGQKVVAAIVEMNAALCEAAAEDFAVKDRSVRRVYVSASGILGDQAENGNYVVIELDPGDPEASTKYRIGQGRDARLGIRRPVLSVTYLPEQETIESTQVVDELADQFLLQRYEPGDGRRLDYRLYVPEHMEPGKKYPLVLFMHDMGACSDDVAAPLAQGNGAVVWTEKEQQEKRPCFVAAPCYPRKAADDEFQVTWEADATVELIHELCGKYPVDEGRIYGTGQSMGCMMLCELNLRYPGLFAGSFLVAGQWDPNRMAAAGTQNLWALVSEKDEKAFPILGACFEEMEKAGEKVVRGHISAKAPLGEQDAALRSLAQSDAHLFFTWYEGKSVLPEGAPDFGGAYHVNTWLHAYLLEAPKEWLFSCVNSRSSQTSASAL